MKKILALATLPLCLVIASCSSQPVSDATATDTNPTTSNSQTAAPKPISLNGDWKQKNSMDDDAYQLATIDGDVISIDWVTNNGDTKSIYWVGSFEAPKDAADSFTWTSTRDRKATDNALMASGDSNKKFTYNNGEISYEAGILGTSTTVRLAKE